MRLLSLSGPSVQSPESPTGSPSTSSPAVVSTLSMTWLWALAVLTVALVVACDRVPLTSPTGSTISLSIDKSVLPINGQATVTAVVTETSGTAVHNGTTVTFQSSLGRTDPIEAQTVNGKAVVTFLAGTISGTASIQAFSGGARTSGNGSSGGIEVRIGTAGADRIGIRTEPNNIPVSGGTVVVIASLFDAGGNPIINTPLTFTSDFGTLSSNSATTDTNGEARVSLTTNRTTTITVTAGPKSQTFNLNALNPPSVTLICGGGTSGNSSASVGVPVNCSITTTASGNSSSTAPIQNVTINWGDGSGEQPVGVNSTTAVSHTYSNTGVFVVTAAATDANSQRGTAVFTLTVTRAIPTVALAVSSGNTSVGVPVTFTVTPPANPPVPTASVVLDFGDGTSRNFGAVYATQSASKSYGSPGSYVASATVTDVVGTRNTTTQAVRVNPPGQPSVALAQIGTLSGGCGVFTVSAAAPDGATITNVSVRQSDSNDAFYSASSGGTFTRCGLAANNILIGSATDSFGQTATTSLLVR